MIITKKPLLWVVTMLIVINNCLAVDIKPWTETVVSVSNISNSARLFRELGGWRLSEKGTVSRAELDYWKLSDLVSAKYERFCAPQAKIGCIRFIQYTGVETRPIRLAKRAWDSGGIYSIMVRSNDVHWLFNQALALGWWAESEPVEFTFKGSKLRNVVLTGPDGIQLAVYERISPPFSGFPVGAISQSFNSMRMVKDKKISRDFYEQKLGFKLVFDSAFEPAEPFPSNFGIPFNYTPVIKRSAAALYPIEGETGRVELMQLEGFNGVSVADFARPPNRGIISVRFPVDNVSSYRSRLIEQGVAIAYEAKALEIVGIGKVDILAVRDPDGAITEFYQVIE
ncbi:MAG: VOC family protein [Methylacidiphilales bacterium]|nr:VOC family protein [Candidatus Methylacidiphilales bacterium]